MRASLLDEFQGPGSMSQTLGQELCRMLVIVWRREGGRIYPGPVARKPKVWGLGGRWARTS